MSAAYGEQEGGEQVPVHEGEWEVGKGWEWVKRECIRVALAKAMRGQTQQ